MAAPPTPVPDVPVTPAPASRGGGKMLALGALIAVLVLVLGAGGAWFVFARVNRDGGENGPDAHKGAAHVWKAGTIVVNVAGTEGRRYLRATVEVGIDPKEVKHLEQSRAPLMDAAIEVLASKRLEQLLEANERERLKDELKRQLNAAVGGTRISQVFLTEFVVQ